MTSAALSEAASRGLGRQWSAAAVLFLFNGVLFASWATEVPRTKSGLGLSELELSGALLALMMGTVVILPLVGPAISRFGLRRVSATAAISGAASLLAAAMADDVLTLGLSLFLYGAAFGAQDVALNNAGVLLEREAKRPLMSGLHAMYSLGALAGALSGAALIWSGAGPVPHFAGLLVAAVLLALGFASGLPLDARDPEELKHEDTLTDRIWSWPLVALGVFAACAAVAEGTVTDWAGVYLKETLLAPDGVEALGYAGFSVAMLLGRIFGDRLSERWGAVRVGRAGALIATTGTLLALSVPSIGLALVGFALMGLGLSVLAPLAFSAVGRVAPVGTARAMAAVTAFFYIGYLVGPPLIGGLAQLSSLRMALSVLLIASLGAGLLSAILRDAPGSRRQVAPAQA